MPQAPPGAEERKRRGSTTRPTNSLHHQSARPKLDLHKHDGLLRAARRQAETPEFQTVYRQYRPMVERSIAWLTRGNRRVRYRGVANNDHWLHHRAAGLNLRRLLNLGLTCDTDGWVIA